MIVNGTDDGLKHTTSYLKRSSHKEPLQAIRYGCFSFMVRLFASAISIMLFPRIPPSNQHVRGPLECWGRLRIFRVGGKNCQNMGVRISSVPAVNLELLVGIRRDSASSPNRITHGHACLRRDGTDVATLWKRQFPRSEERRVGKESRSR